MSHGQPQSSSTHSQKCQLSFSSIFQTPFHVLLRLFCIFFIELKLNYRCSLLGLNINISLLILSTSCQLSYSIMFRIFRLWLRIHINHFHDFGFSSRKDSSLSLSFYFNVVICHLDSALSSCSASSCATGSVPSLALSADLSCTFFSASSHVFSPLPL